MAVGALDDFIGVGNVGRRQPVQHVHTGIAQHAFGPDVEDLDDPLVVGGNAGEVGAVEDRRLQGAGLEQGTLATGFGAATGLAG